MHWKMPNAQQECIEKWDKEKSILTEKKTLPRTRKKMQGAKERSYRGPESRRQCRKRKYQENPEQEKEHEKKKQENPKLKKEYE